MEGGSTVVIARSFAMAVLCVVLGLFRMVAKALAMLIYLPTAAVMLLIGLVILAFMAIEDTCGVSGRGSGCAGASWSANPEQRERGVLSRG